VFEWDPRENFVAILFQGIYDEVDTTQYWRVWKNLLELGFVAVKR
jgi:hypothetical protein